MCIVHVTRKVYDSGDIVEDERLYYPCNNSQGRRACPNAQKIFRGTIQVHNAPQGPTLSQPIPAGPGGHGYSRHTPGLSIPGEISTPATSNSPLTPSPLSASPSEFNVRIAEPSWRESRGSSTSKLGRSSSSRSRSEARKYYEPVFYIGGKDRKKKTEHRRSGSLASSVSDASSVHIIDTPRSRPVSANMEGPIPPPPPMHHSPLNAMFGGIPPPPPAPMTPLTGHHVSPLGEPFGEPPTTLPRRRPSQRVQLHNPPPSPRPANLTYREPTTQHRRTSSNVSVSSTTPSLYPTASVSGSSSPSILTRADRVDPVESDYRAQARADHARNERLERRDRERDRTDVPARRRRLSTISNAATLQTRPQTPPGQRLEGNEEREKREAAEDQHSMREYNRMQAREQMREEARRRRELEDEARDGYRRAVESGEETLELPETPTRVRGDGKKKRGSFTEKWF
ncbi:hypothetical protein P152DRAFT_39902 [Eremomyces bilateralis CBS 781.70]|uniref:Uncharacterized protein n=1 Tax=Eremomyces bilateralis CBS 781.70 TaxID=1392243 RepID=A0A6G1G215_9PEZI|nr:uncharacterized protein P152DRAFT_39902 [Eremomyces bilateralis CBS 781.70]KAF1811966.1 hypothetical protein P152DRAFT_39902 [Eremomyces bilateralis CBS 781.70]